MTTPSYPILPPVKGTTVCAVCGCGPHDTLEMDRLLAVGFGDVQVTRDGARIYSENLIPSIDDFWTAQDAENKARDDPEHDWRIQFDAPLYDATYQRQGDGHWVLVKKGLGFA